MIIWAHNKGRAVTSHPFDWAFKMRSLKKFAPSFLNDFRMQFALFDDEKMIAKLKSKKIHYSEKNSLFFS